MSQTKETSKAKKPIGTWWFWFYTKVRPIVGTILLWYWVKSNGELLQKLNLPWWKMLYFAFSFAPTVLSLIVLFVSLGEYNSFAKFVKPVLLIETFFFACTVGMSINTASFDIVRFLVAFAIAFVVFFFVWYWTNKKYFQKRVGLLGKNGVAKEDENE